MQRDRRTRILGLIALFRLAKAVVLVAVAVGLLQLAHPEIARRVQDWLTALPFVQAHHGLQVAASKVTHAPRGRLEVVASIALGYAVLFAVEGVGLWLARVWAEYLTIVATTSFVPFEVYELVRRFTALRLAALSLNVAIVAYLVLRRVHASRG